MYNDAIHLLTMSFTTKYIYRIPFFIYLLWFTLVAAAVVSAVSQSWIEVFVSLFTLGVSYYIVRLSNSVTFNFSSTFLTLSIIFIYATLFLGEVGGFYHRFWWWDLVLHAGSAIGFGILGVTLLILMFRQKKVTASPFLVSVFAFCFAVAIGALWEIFEFFMDQTFGLNMQKSGLRDTMWDLIVDSAGAFIASTFGYLYLKKSARSGLASLIHDFVEKNT